MRVEWSFPILLLSMAICQRPMTAQRAIPDDNLAYPVLVNLTDCSNNITTSKGSGFFLSTGTAVYLVTARHVLFNEPVPPTQTRSLLCKKAELLSYSKDPKDKQPNHLEVDLQSLNDAGRVKAHATHDVAVAQIGTVTKTVQAENSGLAGTFLPGIRAIQMSPSGLLSAGVADVKKLNEVLTADDIYVFGYPSSIGIQQAPQIDYNSPLIRKGIIAGVNDAKRTIILDCLTFHGNSGGPVLEATRQAFNSKFNIIGVISQYVPVTETWVNATQNYANLQVYNSGYSIAEPMDVVLELIGQ
jgi:hypothetical protein